MRELGMKVSWTFAIHGAQFNIFAMRQVTLSYH